MAWVAELNATLAPIQQAILDTPVIEDAAENRLVDAKIQNFLVAFYPIIRDFPHWLQLLLYRSPQDGKVLLRDHSAVEKRHDARWRPMGARCNDPRERYGSPERIAAHLKRAHGYGTHRRG